uniref:Pyrroline-5-carboxylate reductase n=1 Tax=Acidicaldus sp. TaxID=1872105 RepID=A0A8J4H8K2_9PROT
MSEAPLPPLLLIGCGRMGSALLAGWREAGLAEVVIVDPARPELLAPARVVTEAAAIPRDFAPQAVIFAIKPQEAEATLAHYARFRAGAVFLSIMAGRTIAGMERLLGAGSAIVRAMPNTPAAIRQGITAAYAGASVSAAQRALTARLVGAIGEVAWVDAEAELDAVTAVSGSGPAYVFLLAELMEQAGIAEGLTPDLARRLARRTVAGSGALLAASAEEASALRQAVTSKGGTTQAALDILMAPEAWPASVRRAIEAAAMRSRALAR